MTQLQERMKLDFISFAREVVPPGGDWYELSLGGTVKRAEDGTVTLPMGLSMRIGATKAPWELAAAPPRPWWQRVLHHA